MWYDGRTIAFELVDSPSAVLRSVLEECEAAGLDDHASAIRQCLSSGEDIDPDLLHIIKNALEVDV